MSVNIHIFYGHISGYNTEQLPQLPQAEQERAMRFTHTKRRQLFVTGRTILMQGLVQLDESPLYSITYSCQGKPELTTPTAWHCSITHSGPHVMVALSQHTVGIDSEILTPRNYIRIAEKLFPEKALEELRASSNDMNCFYKHWTRHEAMIKFSGLSVFNALPANINLNTHSFQHKELAVSVCSAKNIKNVHLHNFQ